jgi:hypothetical protein
MSDPWQKWASKTDRADLFRALVDLGERGLAAATPEARTDILQELTDLINCPGGTE